MRLRNTTSEWLTFYVDISGITGIGQWKEKADLIATRGNLHISIGPDSGACRFRMRSFGQLKEVSCLI